MTNSLPVFKVGTRQSKLALFQANDSLGRLGRILPNCRFEVLPMDTPGDRDRTSNLQTSAEDFFTRDLDDALLAGTIDAAIHSAKDCAYPMREEIDWIWLPWKEPREDALILRTGENADNLPGRAILGVSSPRREEYCRRRFPGGELRSIRGNIENRIEQLDAGKFDALIMAVAALNRLGLQKRITEIIPLTELPSPEAQGRLCLTVRKGDRRFEIIRSLFIAPVVFASAGVGEDEQATLGCIEALVNCDVCLYDSLLPLSLLRHCSENAGLIPVGKRRGSQIMKQEEITGLILDEARKGKRVVRLKGGDAGIFGRLAEEIEKLEEHSIPYRVLPGISAFQAACASTGMLLTRRGDNAGFVVATPRRAKGDAEDGTLPDFGQLPCVLYMSISVFPLIAEKLIADGKAPDTPAAIVFNAGSISEHVMRGTLASLPARVADDKSLQAQPGLIYIGTPASRGFNRQSGALAGRKVLLTCSESVLPKAARQTRRYGGYPIPLPCIRQTPESGALKRIESLSGYDALIVTSPGAALCFFNELAANKTDLRKLPAIFVCGPGTAGEFESKGIFPEILPTNSFGAESLCKMLRDRISPGAKILRLRSDVASGKLAKALTDMGAKVDDIVLYKTEMIEHETLPEFDDIFFASSSAVHSFVKQWGKASLGGKRIIAIGKPTSDALNECGIATAIIADEATVDSAIEKLALEQVRESLTEFAEES